MTDVRAFIALELPDQVLAMLERMQAKLARALPRGVVRWTRPEGIHLTLKFLGNVPEDQLAAIMQVLDDIALEERELTLATAGLGYFPPRGAVRVLWLGVNGELGALAALQRRIDDALATLGFAPERRAFAPHLTLGRVREGAAAADLRAVAAAVAGAAPEAPLLVPVRHLTLFQSQLRPGGAEYRVLHRAALAASERAAGN